MRRLLLVVAVITVGTLGVVTAALAENGQGPIAQPGGLGGIGAPAAAPAYQPAAAARDVSPTTTPSVTLSDGTLRDVALTADDGTAVRGTLAGDRHRWAVDGDLDYGTTYTWSGTASGPDGRDVPLAGSFETVKPAKEVRGTVNIGDGRTVGVAAPIEIQFDAHVPDRAAVERALKVETSEPTEGAWGWLPDENGGSRVHWRPKEYWKPNTEVTVTADLFGVAYGEGAYGKSDVTSTFAIGRSQVVKADVHSHQMVVVRDGRTVATFAASYGLDSDPNRNTRSGIHVVTEKFTDKRMVSQQYGYDQVEKWAVRISNNGEFVHANPATSGVQGSQNVSHGCVNLSLADAKSYFDTAIYGDPVEVTGSGVQLSARDGDIWDWTLSWAQWKQLSALD